jgi:F-type H+-transporting ATPase subunit b
MEGLPMMSVSFRRRLPLILPVPATIIFFLIALPAFAAGGGEGGGGLTVIPDWTFLLQMANFLILMWIMNVILYKPIRNVLIQRKNRVSGLEESIVASEKDVKDKEEAFMVGIRDARAKGMKQKESLIAEATVEEKKIIAAINEKAQADLAEVRGQISKEAQVAKDSLMQEIDDFSEAIGQKILGRAI